MSLTRILNTMKSNPAEAEKLLRGKIEAEWKRTVRSAVEQAFLEGELNWINHPDRVSYSWKYMNARTVLAQATYREKTYVRRVRLPRFAL